MSKHWDFFIAYSHQDRTAANALYRGLAGDGHTRVFLDREELAAGDRWAPRLKEALSHSRVIVILVSRHSDRSWYQQEEVAIAIALVREHTRAYTIVPVMLDGARRKDVPYGLLSLDSLRESELGMDGVCNALLGLSGGSKQRPRTEMLGHSVAIFDDLWSRAEPVVTDAAARVPQQYRRRFSAEGTDLVSREHGEELQRVTRKELESRLGPEDLEYIEDLERSMEINRALWKKAYPRRAISKSSAKTVQGALSAMAEDLEGVLSCLERAQLWLDDHYLNVRNILAHAKR